MQDTHHGNHSLSHVLEKSVHSSICPGCLCVLRSSYTRPYFISGMIASACIYLCLGRGGMTAHVQFKHHVYIWNRHLFNSLCLAAEPIRAYCARTIHRVRLVSNPYPNVLVPYTAHSAAFTRRDLESWTNRAPQHRRPLVTTK